MISYPIQLTNSRAKRLKELAEIAGYNDAFLFLQNMVNELTDSADILGKMLAKEIGK